MDFTLLKTLTVLYVEDELSLQEDICQNIAALCTEESYVQMMEKRVWHFLWKHQDEIDLIISDILMPKMNGIEMIHTIRDLRCRNTGYLHHGF